MKTAIILLALFFLFALTTSTPPAADEEYVYDTDGEPVRNGGIYRIFPWFTVAELGNCSYPVVSLNFPVPRGSFPLRIESTDNSPFIKPNMPLNISFTGLHYRCLDSYMWRVVESLSYIEDWPRTVGNDRPVLMTDGQLPAEGIVKGAFHVEQHGLDYKLVFCRDEDTKRCANVGAYNIINNIVALVVTDGTPLGAKFLKADGINSVITTRVSGFRIAK